MSLWQLHWRDDTLNGYEGVIHHNLSYFRKWRENNLWPTVFKCQNIDQCRQINGYTLVTIFKDTCFSLHLHLYIPKVPFTFKDQKIININSKSGGHFNVHFACWTSSVINIHCSKKLREHLNHTYLDEQIIQVEPFYWCTLYNLLRAKLRNDSQWKPKSLSHWELDSKPHGKSM